MESGWEHVATGNVSFSMNHLMYPQQLVLGIDTLTHCFPREQDLLLKFQVWENQHSPNSLGEVKNQQQKSIRNHTEDREGQESSLFESPRRTPAQEAAGASAGMGTQDS